MSSSIPEKGINDLATLHPELAKEADGWDPSQVIAGTGKKLPWKCKEGHTWIATGYNRINGKGCPYCANRKAWSGFNDLATLYPELAKEADGWDPRTIIPGTSKNCLGNAKKVIHGQPHVVKEQVLLHQGALNVLNMDLILVNQHGFI